MPGFLLELVVMTESHDKCLFFLRTIKFYQCYFSKAAILETNNLGKYNTELSFLLHLSGTQTTHIGKASFGDYSV